MKRIAGPLLAAVVFAAGCQSQPFHSSLSDKQSIFDKKSPAKADGASLAKQSKAGQDGRATGEVNHHRLAVLSDQKKNYGEAERHYRLAMQQQQDDPNLLCDYGYSKLLQQQYKESEQLLTQALAIDPNHEKALYNLGYLHAKQGDAQRAYAYFRQAGSEDRARSLMASLFPKGYDGPIQRASERSPLTAGRGTLHAPPPTGTPEYDQYMKNLSKEEMLQLLAQRREESIARRRQKSYSGSGGASPWQDSRHDTNYGAHRAKTNSRNDNLDRNQRYSGVASNATDGRSDFSQRPDHRSRAGIVPDHELSKRMREIDREYADRTYRNSPYGNQSSIRNSSGSGSSAYPPARGTSNRNGSGYDRRYDGGTDNRTEPRQSPSNRLLFPPEDTENTTSGNSNGGTDVRSVASRQYVPARQGYPEYGTGDRSGTQNLQKQAPYGITPSEANRQALRLGHNTGTGAPFPMTSRSGDSSSISGSGANANHADYTGRQPGRYDSEIERSALGQRGFSGAYPSRYDDRGTSNLTAPPPSSGYSQQDRNDGNRASSNTNYGRSGGSSLDYQDRYSGASDRHYQEGPVITPRNVGGQTPPTGYGSPQYPSNGSGSRY